MAWQALAGQALGAAGSIFGGAGQAAPAAPTISEGGTVTVSVGGLNVPAFPNFPNYSATTEAGSTMSIKPNNDLLLYALGGVVLIALLKKR